AGCLNGEELSSDQLQYVDYCEWQNELLETEDESKEQAAAFWQRLNELLNSTPALTLPLEVQSIQEFTSRPSRLTVGLSSATAARIDEAVSKEGVPAAVYLLACWQSLLSRLTKQTNVLVESSFDGRKFDEFQTALGVFAKTLPLVAVVQGNTPFN